MKKYFTFEIQIKDDKGINRRFRASNYQSSKSKHSAPKINGIHYPESIIRDYPHYIMQHFYLCKM